MNKVAIGMLYLSILLITSCSGGGSVGDNGGGGTPNVLDTTPTSFSLTTDKTDIAFNTVVSSNSITVSGIDAAAEISIEGGEYSIDAGVFTSAVGTVNNGQTVSVRQTSSDQSETTTRTTLTIGGISAVFSVTTPIMDIDPEPFTLTTDTPDIGFNTVVSSNSITVSGIDAAAKISIEGGEYSIDEGDFTSEEGTINNGQTVSVRQTSSGESETETISTLIIGGVSTVFSVTTPIMDTEPEPFTLTTDTLDIGFDTVVSSKSITVSGINVPVAISIKDGEYSIDEGVFTSAVGTVNNGQKVLVRQTSSDKSETTTSTELTIGSVSRTFSVTTLADNIAPTVMVNFPTSVALTEGDTVTVRGTATDQEGTGVADVKVNDVSVDSDDGYASWSVEVQLTPGSNTLTVTAEDNTGNPNDQAVELSIVSDILFDYPTALALDSDNGRILVLDVGLSALIAVDLVSGLRSTVSNSTIPDGVNAFFGPSALVVDSANDRALVLDSQLKSLIAVDLDSGKRTIVSNNTTPDGDNAFSDPRDLILDSVNTRALVVDAGLDALIAVNLSGNETGERTIVSDNTTPENGGPVFDTPTYLTLDSEENRVLVSDSSFGLEDREPSLISVNLDSRVRELVGNIVSGVGALAFDSDENRVLVAGGFNEGLSLYSVDFDDNKTSTVSSNTNPNGDNAFESIVDVVMGNDRALVLDGSLKAIIAVDLKNGARSRQGGIPNGGNNVFVRPHALILDSANNRALVLDSRLKAIIAVNLDNGERSIVSSSTIPNGENAFDLPTALALDSANKRALVLDDGLDALIAVKLEDGARSILSNNTMPDGDNAFDSIVDVVIDNDRALVLDSSLKALIAVDLDSGKRAIVSDSTTPLNGENAFDLPTALALDSANKRALVLDDGLDALIAVNLDSGARSIVSDDTTPNKTNSFSRPSALVLDSANNRALVLDPGLNALIAVNLGNGARTIVSNITTLNGDNGFDSPMDLLLDSDNNRVLVVDRSLRAVIAVDLVSGSRVILSK